MMARKKNSQLWFVCVMVGSLGNKQSSRFELLEPEIRDSVCDSILKFLMSLLNNPDDSSNASLPMILRIFRESSEDFTHRRLRCRSERCKHFFCSLLNHDQFVIVGNFLFRSVSRNHVNRRPFHHKPIIVSHEKLRFACLLLSFSSIAVFLSIFR